MSETEKGLTLSLTCPRRRLLYPNQLTLEAKLQCGDGQPLAGVRVMFEAELDDGFEPVAHALTDQQGICSIKLRIRRGRRYRARLPGGNDLPDLLSSPAAIDVIPRLEARLTTPRVARGSRAVVAGLIRPRKRFLRVEVERNAGAGAWIPFRSYEVRLVRGKFEAAIAAEQEGAYRCRVIFHGDAHHEGATSAWLPLQVSG